MKKSLLIGFAVGFIAGTANVLNIIKHEERGLNRSPLTKWKDHLVEKLDYLLFAYHRHGQQPEYRQYTYQQRVYNPPRYNHYRGTYRYVEPWTMRKVEEEQSTDDIHDCTTCKYFDPDGEEDWDCVYGDRCFAFDHWKEKEEAEET